MRRLIWGFAGHTYHVVWNLMHWLIYEPTSWINMVVMSVLSLSLLVATFVICWFSLQTDWTQQLLSQMKNKSRCICLAVWYNNRWAQNKDTWPTNSCFMVLSLCPLWNYHFFKNIFFWKISFRNMIRVSNRLDPDEARHFVGPDLGQNCLQRLSADDTSR